MIPPDASPDRPFVSLRFAPVMRLAMGQRKRVAKVSLGPDGAWILGTGTDHIAVTFDRLGRDVTKTDQRGVVHTLERDSAGRIAADIVTTLPAGVDGAVRRIGQGFDDVGRGNRVTSYADVTGTQVVNEITYRFGSFGELRELAQDHSGPVTAASPKIVYDYNAFLRRTLTIYPNGRQVIQTFDALQHLDSQTDGVSPFATYTYQGMGNIVKVEHPKVTGGLTWSPVLDRFGRAQEIAWTRTDGTFADRFQYGYDNANRRVWRKTLATGAPNTQDEFLTYDTLDRLTSNKVGILTGTAPDYTGIQTPVTNLSWTLDPIGNWSQFGRSDASVSFVQNRSHNAANEIDVDTFDTNAPGNAIALVSGNAAGNWVDPRYDAAGNSTYLPLAGQESVSTNARLLTWDAWNRLASMVVDLNGNGVADVSDIQITKYGYDGKNQRIWSATYVPASSNYTRRDYLLNEAWQTLEERSGVVTDFNTQTTVPQIQYLWDARYIDTPVCRWRDANADGVWEETLYALNDTNMHLTALVDQNGAVVERYSYEAYGKQNILTATFGARSASAYAWTYGFTGREWNSESGMWYFRNRMYSDSLGRFVSRDPMGYVDGMSLYGGYFVPNGMDPIGTASLSMEAKYSYGGLKDVLTCNWLVNWDGPGKDLTIDLTITLNPGNNWNAVWQRYNVTHLTLGPTYSGIGPMWTNNPIACNLPMILHGSKEDGLIIKNPYPAPKNKPDILYPFGSYNWDGNDFTISLLRHFTLEDEAQVQTTKDDPPTWYSDIWLENNGMRSAKVLEAKQKFTLTKAKCGKIELWEFYNYEPKGLIAASKTIKYHKDGTLEEGEKPGDPGFAVRPNTPDFKAGKSPVTPPAIWNTENLIHPEP